MAQHVSNIIAAAQALHQQVEKLAEESGCEGGDAAKVALRMVRASQAYGQAIDMLYSNKNISESDYHDMQRVIAADKASLANPNPHSNYIAKDDYTSIPEGEKRATAIITNYQQQSGLNTSLNRMLVLTNQFRPSQVAAATEEYDRHKMNGTLNEMHIDDSHMRELLALRELHGREQRAGRPIGAIPIDTAYNSAAYKTASTILETPNNVGPAEQQALANIRNQLGTINGFGDNSQQPMSPSSAAYKARMVQAEKFMDVIAMAATAPGDTDIQKVDAEGMKALAMAVRNTPKMFRG